MTHALKSLLIVFGIAVVVSSIASREAKADSFADDICGQLRNDRPGIAATADASSSVLSRWCVATFDAFVDLLLIPTLYDLRATGIHPSTVSVHLDGIYEDFTEYLTAEPLAKFRI